MRETSKKEKGGTRLQGSREGDKLAVVAFDLMNGAKARLAGYGDGEATAGERMTEAGAAALSDPDLLSGDSWQFAFDGGFKGQCHGEAEKLELSHLPLLHRAPPKPISLRHTSQPSSRLQDPKQEPANLANFWRAIPTS